MHNISIVLIAKDETDYLEEYINYYLLLGVDHFYIYDNESAVPIKKTLANYSDCCDIIYFPGKTKQYEAYNHFIKNFRTKTKWAIPIDADEFIVLRKHNTLTEFIKEFRYADAIALNWVYFGDSYLDTRPEGLVIENYTLCESGQNKHIKTIVRSKAWKDCSNVHFLTIKRPGKYIDCHHNKIFGPFNENYTTDTVQINHYFSKSKEECIKKYQRGRADTDTSFNLTEDVFLNWRKSLNVKRDTFLKDSFGEKIKISIEQRKNIVVNSTVKKNRRFSWRRFFRSDKNFFSL